MLKIKSEFKQAVSTVCEEKHYEYVDLLTVPALAFLTEAAFGRAHGFSYGR